METNITEKLAIVGHDWGSFFTQILASRIPEKISAVVLLDVGLGFDKSYINRLFLFTYQLSLIQAYLLPGFIGNPISRAWASIAHSPTLRKDRKLVQSKMNYI